MNSITQLLDKYLSVNKLPLICENCNNGFIPASELYGDFDFAFRCRCQTFGYGKNLSLIYFSRRYKQNYLSIININLNADTATVYFRHNQKLISINQEHYDLLPICCSNDDFLKFIRNILILQ